MGNSKFEGSYEVDDGYVGGSRPLYFNIDESDIEEDMTESELSELFDDEMQGHFEMNISPGERNKERFMSWAKEIVTKQDSI